MDRNLERNLAKVNAWRAQGHLPKARRRLAELAQEHPDTPDYRLELARVCLEQGDSHAGLAEVRVLLRQLPDRRDELLASVEEHFQAASSLPAGQFLFEDHLAHADLDAAALVLERFNEAQLQQTLERYGTKIASVESHRPDAGGEMSPEARARALRQAWWGSFHCALALKRYDDAAAHATLVLRAAEADGKLLLGWLERRARSAQTPPPIMAVLGEARVRDGRVVDGLSALLGAAERDRALLPRVRQICDELAPLLGDLPAGLRARGHLARLAGNAEEAIDLYRQAVTRDPQGIRSLLELITPETDTPATRPYSLFRVELLARASDGAGLAAALEQLRQTPGVDPAALRALLAPHLESATPDPVLLLSATTLAIRAGDADEFERLLPACSHLTRAQAQRLIHAIETRLNLLAAEPEMVTDPITGEMVAVGRPQEAEAPVGDPAERARWLRLLVRLHAAIGDAGGANARLLLVWQESARRRESDPAAREEMAGFTREILARVPPTAATLATLLPAAAPQALVSDLLARLAETAAPAADDAPELEAALVSLARGDGAQARLLREQFAARPELAARLPWADAAVRLLGGDEDGGVQALDALARGRPDLEEKVLELLLVRARRRPPHAATALAAAKLLRMDDRLSEAVEVLQPVQADCPERSEEIGLFFESVLAAEPEHVDVWLAYLDGLLRAGRYRRLRQVLPRAEQTLPAVEIGRLRVYRARLRFEEGDPPGALLECELALQLADPPLAQLDALLSGLLVVNPALARAHLLRGAVAAAAGNLAAALPHYAEALRHDPALRPEAARAIRRLADGRLLSGADSLALARFHGELGSVEEAAAFYQEALQASPAVAREVAADLRASAAAAQDPRLGQCLAQALRLGGQPDEAAEALARLCAQDGGRLDWALKELAALESAFPTAIGPARARAQLLGLPFEEPAPAPAPELAVEAPPAAEAVPTPAAEPTPPVAPDAEAVAAPDPEPEPAVAATPASEPEPAVAAAPASEPEPAVATELASTPERAAETAPAPSVAAAPSLVPEIPLEPTPEAAPGSASEPESALESAPESALDSAPPPEPAPASGPEPEAAASGEAPPDDAAPAASTEQDHLAAAVRLAMADRPLEALAHLRALPLGEENADLPPAARAQALWLLAHIEESRGRWAEACACYRALAALPGEAEQARWWHNLNYGRLLEQSESPQALVLEKTGALPK